MLNMMIRFTTLCSTMLACLVALPATAGIIEVNTSSGSFELHANSMNILGSTSPYLTSADLAVAHSILNDWGIDTNEKITILPVHTDVGLSFLTLIDEETGGGDTGSNATLGITSTASSSLEMYINDATQDAWQLIQPPFGSQTLGTTFAWGSEGSGDGFAWTDLAYYDSFSYSFNNLDGMDNAFDENAFQFVSWGDEGWEVVSTNGFNADGTHIFTGITIPGPPAALIIAALALNRRRRRH
jgi:hypothetical protein